MGKTIALDFDGVLHQYSGWKGTELDGPIPGALEAVNKLLAEGFNVVVYTTREPYLVSTWLASHGFPELYVTDGKPLAMCYVDDRAFRFDGAWDAGVVARISSFRTYWEYD